MNEADKLRALVRIRGLTASGAARSARVASRLSLSELARRVDDVSPSTIYRWETCRRSPRGSLAIRYLEVIDELMNR
jgi:DNA-binding transcriptional regulator YiaG